MAPLSWSWIAVSLLVFLASSSPRTARAGPTSGFTAVPLDESNFQLQLPYPYNLRRDARYRFDGTVRRLWVYSYDKPYSPTSSTKPRTEMQITEHDYNSGVWQFEGYCYVPAGTSGASIMQVFGGSPTATTLMLHVYDGGLWYYDQKFVEGNIYDRWFRVNVVHDVGKSRLTVYIDGQKKLDVPGKGGSSYFFKFGVYGQRRESTRMESRWMNVRILRKN